MYYLEGKNTPVVSRTKLFKDAEYPMVMVDYKKDDDRGNPFRKNEFEISGLALEFSRIKKDKDIVDFSSKYGMLGINCKENIVNLDFDYYYLNNFQYADKSRIEYLGEWYWHRDHIRKLFKLFNALQNNLPIEEELLRIKKRQNLYPPSGGIYSNENLKNIPVPVPAGKSYAETKPYIAPEHHIYWAEDDKPTQMHYSKLESATSIEDEFRMHAWLILETHIKPIVEKAIFIDFSSPRLDKKSFLGISYTDRKATNYLLAAIYYDMYRIVNNIDEVISFCSVCGGPYKSKRKGSMYCGNACKQEKKRQPKEGVDNSG